MPNAVSAGTNPSATVSGFSYGENIYWEVRACNTTCTYTSVENVTAYDCSPPYGNHDASTCTTIAGWTCQDYQNNYNSSNRVDLYIGPGFTNYLGSVTANGYRPDVAAAGQCGGTAYHGFDFSVPSTYWNTNTYSVYAYGINLYNPSGGPNPLLWNSPKSFGPCTGNILVTVYEDLNDNGVQNTGEPGYPNGATVTVTGQGKGTYTTDINGQISIPNLIPGSSTLTLQVPPGYNLTTTNPVTTTVQPGITSTVNFGIAPLAPTCSGGITANPTSINQGGTSSLSASCSNPSGLPITYTWSLSLGDPGTISNTGGPTSTYTASANAQPNGYVSYPVLTVCDPGGIICSSYTTQIDVYPLFTISGDVFVDQNKNQIQDLGEPTYSGGITISPSPNPSGVTVTYPNTGTYLISNLPAGSYTIYYTNPPTSSGYQMTYPNVPPPPSFNVSVGPPNGIGPGGTSLTSCNASSSNSASCVDASGNPPGGNIENLRFGITNSIPWIEGTGGDLSLGGITNPKGGGFNDPVPAGSCGGVLNYASIVGSRGTPGIINSGSGSYSFGTSQASQAPYNWVVGGLSSPNAYIFTLPIPGTVQTSYNYISSLATQSNIKPVDITSYCGGGGLTNCNLSSGIPHGIYIANGDLTLGNGTGGTYTFPAGNDYVILVNGNLDIKEKVIVPNGSTAFFTATGNITVDRSVGESSDTTQCVLSTSTGGISTGCDVEGYYSTDKSFILDGNNSCPTTDLRLNMDGSIVVNAALSGGSLVNNRDLCQGDLYCPTFNITERPDFILNSPFFIMNTRRIWQEIAP